MDADVTIGFIGGGNMASAILRGLLRSGHRPSALMVSEPDAERRRALGSLDPDLRVLDENAGVANRAEVLVLAVKPQVLGPVARDLGQQLGSSRPLVLSVAAGVPTGVITEWLGQGVSVVRAMPNQPALVGHGITAMVAAGTLDEDHRRRAEYLMRSVGEAVWLDDERLMDAVTAVSGSGPAYFYLLMELMEQAALELGLPAELAARLVRHTAAGAGRAALESGRAPSELRASVTSPGGTTAAALAVLEDAGLPDTVRRALTAARDRSLELGRVPADRD